MLIVEDEPYMAEAIRDGLRLEAIAAGCWFGPAWTCDCPIWAAAWPSAGHTVLGSASPSAAPWSLRGTSTGDAEVEGDDACDR